MIFVLLFAQNQEKDFEVLILEFLFFQGGYFLNFSRFLFLPLTIVLLIAFLFLKIKYNDIEILNFHLAFFVLCLAVYFFYKIFFYDKFISLNLIFTLITTVVVLSLSFLVFRYSVRLRTSAEWKLIFDFKLEASLYIYMTVCVFAITFVDMLINKKGMIEYICLFVFLVAYSLFLLYSINNNITEVYYTISKPLHYKSEKNLKIAHVSDLHNTIHNNNQRDLTDRIIKFKPDLIFLTGDIADAKFDFQGTLLLLEQLEGVAPIYYVTGNHEYWSAALNEELEIMKSYGLIYLDGKTEKINFNNQDIYISGFDDPLKYGKIDGEKYVEESLSSLENSSEDLKLLLFHRPEFVEQFGKHDFDVIFSGHAHGGQVIIPKLVNGIYAPNQGLFPKYAGGRYELENSSTLIVSRGLSIHYLPRVFNPPELVFVTITN